jgi:hypothetical protein
VRSLLIAFGCWVCGGGFVEVARVLVRELVVCDGVLPVLVCLQVGAVIRAVASAIRVRALVA